eukprot:GILJ01004656.1.p1 GENE.GILJ01004656.1~~GILJ01004656.1.p1  ORF type:complete len:2862 (-),score=582.32 GILJ01004656.1:82-7611(-)
MVAPDLDMICEIMLMSEGFNAARLLARKMTVLYKLAKEQLSKQFHYDFGLRAIKSVLVMAGSLKREAGDLPEEQVLMRALRDMNMPKFVYEDVPLFRGLLNDLFPGLDVPRVVHKKLKEAVFADLEEKGYAHKYTDLLELQVDKVIQLYETMLTRHTTMVVGPTGGGKSVVLETLKNAQLKAFGVTTKLYILNPKAQSVAELYGVLDPNTRDWTDGLLSKIFRDINTPLPADKKEARYIVFDGDVDAVWVENMNTVMDDNKLLTLTNGERIRLQRHCAMLFEVSDLQYASPATISRCGMVYIDPKNLGYEPFYDRWIKSRKNPEQAEILENLFEKYIPIVIEYVCEGLINGEVADERLQTIIPMNNISMVKQLCTLLAAILNESRSGITDNDVIEHVFLFCLVWSVGGTLLESSRVKFDEFVKNLSGKLLPSSALYENFYDVEQMKWVPWNQLVAEYTPPADGKFSKILVPTVDTVRYSYLLGLMIEMKNPVLFVGESGTAKTATIQNYLSRMDTESNLQLTINFSSRTMSLDVQRTLEDNIDKRTGKIYGPPAGKRLICFIDDLNMPAVDRYGTQQPIALLFFLLDKGVMYERGGELDRKIIKDTQFVSAMAPPGGGRNKVDPRFVSLFTVFNITFPSDESIQRIYTSILAKHLENFSEEVQELPKKLTQATLQFYKMVVEQLPRTPSKFHYIFNLRDLSRVYEGLCLSTVDKCYLPPLLVRLWRNELLRVFSDRLISEPDRSLVNNRITEIVSSTFPEYADSVLVNPVLFGDFALASPNEENPELYEDLGSYETVRKVFEGILEEYNGCKKAMNLVLFEDALEHLTRIHRILKLPRGNALLVGVGGSGKQSLTKLAAFTAKCEVFQISLSRNYGESEFREDLKSLYQRLGSKQMVFLFTDSHVVEEGFLELVNNMLTTGMVPALYTDEERSGIVSGVREEVKKKGIVDSEDNCWQYFVNKCRDNLHVVLAMSPAGESLRIRCRNFPGLVNNTVIDWFFAWPEDALRSVATQFLADENLPETSRNDIIEHIVLVHTSVLSYSVDFEARMRRKNHSTPKNFLDYISNYRNQLQSNRFNVDQLTKRLDGGLTKLIEAAEAVDLMSVDLAEKKKEVDEKTRNVEVLINQITTRSVEAAKKKEEATKKREELTEDNQRIQIEKEAADKALEEALPALEAAADALKGLNKNDLTEIKSFSNPPFYVLNVLVCVMILNNENESGGWKAARAMMSAPDFMKKLIDYPKDEMTDRMARKVKEYFKDEQFNEQTLGQVSRAGKGLFMWVEAMLKYHAIAREVEPKKRLVKQMQKSLETSKRELEEIESELSRVTEEKRILEEKLSEAKSEQKQLQDEANMMERKLTAASKLISGLTSERSRWTADKDELKSKKNRLVGDSLLAAAFLSYTGAFNFDFRKQMVYTHWHDDILNRGLPLTQPYRVEDLLTTDVEISRWASQGLPSDELSVQNGILTTRSSRWPLCVDPQMQAVKWIKNKEDKQGLVVKTFNDSDFLKYLELAIQYGKPFLFESVDEELDPVIDPVLEKNIIQTGAQKSVMIGDKAVDWDDRFRLYLTSKLANPHYTPEISGKTMLINYNVTLQGLQDQLLNVVVGQERSDLEDQRTHNIQQMSDDKAKVKELEDTLLRELANSSGNLLDNEELISTLEDAKSKSIEIAQRLEEGKFTSQEIEKARSAYRRAAKRGAILYFAMVGMSSISKMYEYSLEAYLGVFVLALQKSKKDAVLENRLRNIIEKLTQDVYNYTCMGIFEVHKLMFSFQMTLAIMDGEGEINQLELDFFLKGNTALEQTERKKPFAWIPDEGWNDLQRLVTVHTVFENLILDVEVNEQIWKQWYDNERPEDLPLPLQYSETLSRFEQLLVLRVFRIDRVYNAIKNFVMYRLGDYYVQPPTLKYDRIYAQSTPTSPVVFILSPGADPQSHVQKLGDDMGFTGHKFKFLALGQGMGPQAVQFIEAGASRGHWVLLQNCHLLTSWLKTLEKILDSLQKPHKDFRLWLTTEPTPKFPLGILQRSLKVVTEPPDGLKLNMRGSYSKINKETIDSCPHWAFRPLIYVLSFFHAVVQERRKYGKIGWNVKYDFNDSDFQVSLRLLGMYLTKAHDNNDEQLPWGSLRYLIGEAMYGGRVTDDFDRRVLVTYLDEYMGDFLFDDFQPFFFSRAGFEYQLPQLGPLENYTSMVESLPLNNGPEVFGLHSNAEIGYFTSSSKAVFTDLLSMQTTKSDSSLGSSREEIINNIATDIQFKVPDPFDELALKKKFENPLPAQVVLLQEVERWNVLVRNMSESLRDLKRALIGEIGMSSELDDLAVSLFNGFLPDMWRRLAPATQKRLGSWIIHFQKRYAQYREWIERGEVTVMWLSGLHIPESYLTALVQMACREKGWALDKSTLYTRVTSMSKADKITEKPAVGCYVTGLYLEGASWDEDAGMLRRQHPKELVVEMPVMQVVPVEANKLKLTNTFKTPVYVTQNRRNAMGVGLVFEADLPTHEHSSHWVLQGVCLCLNIDV